MLYGLELLWLRNRLMGSGVLRQNNLSLVLYNYLLLLNGRLVSDVATPVDERKLIHTFVLLEGLLELARVAFPGDGLAHCEWVPLVP